MLHHKSDGWRNETVAATTLGLQLWLNPEVFAGYKSFSFYNPSLVGNRIFNEYKGMGNLNLKRNGESSLQS